MVRGEKVGEGLFVAGSDARFCFGSGSTRSRGGVPTTARALALAALTLEKVCFFDLAT